MSISSDLNDRLQGMFTTNLAGDVAIRTLASGAGANSIGVAELLLGIGGNAFSAGNLPILDAGGYFTGTEVETALQEIGLALAASGTPAPTNATYITQVPNGTLTAEQALSLLGTGVMKSTTGTGVVSIAINGTDYYGPGTPTPIPVAEGGTGGTTQATARTGLGLVIGTDVQAWGTNLDSWSLKTVPSGTIVDTSTAQVLTNKTFVDSTTFIRDDIDASKQVTFQLSGITTGQTRIIQFPDQDCTLAVQGAFTSATVPNGGTGAATFTQDGVILGNGVNPLTATAAGGNDLPLRVPTAGGAPAFGVLKVAGGGTGAATLTLDGVVLGNGTGTVVVTAAGAADLPLVVPTGGGTPLFQGLKVPGGGTGLSTVTTDGVLYGAGTGNLVVTAQGAANTVLAANAGAPFFTGSVTLSSGVTTKGQAALVLEPFNTAAGNTGELRFLELAAGGTHYVGFKASDALAGNVIWTLPIADGTANQVLTTSGAGVLSWATASGGSAYGTGADGAGSFLVGTTNLDAGGVRVVTLNYTSLTIAVGATLQGINPHADGTVFVINVTGNADISGTLNLSGMGAHGGASNGETFSGTWARSGDGNPGTAGYLHESFGGGGIGKHAASTSVAGGGGGAGTFFASGVTGATASDNGQTAAGGAGGADYLVVYNAYVLGSGSGIIARAGSGGGSGGYGINATGTTTGTIASGAGGKGGGGLHMSIGGTLGLTGTVDIRGAVGGNGSQSFTGGSADLASAGGGGGAGGIGTIIVRGVITESGSNIEYSGGLGGSSSQTGGNSHATPGGDAGSGILYTTIGI